jgi:hypothetical protein
MEEQDSALDDSYIQSIESEQECWNPSDWIHPNISNCFQSPSLSPNSASTGQSDEDNEPPDESDPTDLSGETIDNEYIRGIMRTVDLCIQQVGHVTNAYNSQEKEVELFHLFLTKNYLETVARWTNEVLVEKGRKALYAKEFFAYMGLELGMSLLKFNSMKSYWARGNFLGHETFRTTMSRTRFQEIRSSIRFTSNASYDNESASSDPLWSCRSLIDQFIRKSASIAVPLGVSALDENSCPTKARTKAKTYSPNKPAKYAIRFYAVVGHRFCYLSSMFDNRAGNTTGIPGIHDYCRLFRTLRTPYNKVIGNDKSKDSLAETPSALWVCMMAHQTANCKQPSGGKRYFFCDNYYTRHTLACALREFTDGEAHMIGTVKFTNVDATNRYYLSKAIELLKDKERGAWALVRAYNKHADYDRLRNSHASQQRRIATSSQRTTFVPPLDNIADRSGYIVFKDSKVVIFYTNDLLQNPSEPILLGTDDRAHQCVGGLAKISRWTGVENLHRTEFYVAAPIVAYNMFMNGVDRMDQYRATLATQRREKRLHMTIFTYILDLAITQAYAVYQKVALERQDPVISYFSFKRNICNYLILPWKDSRGRTDDTLLESTPNDNLLEDNDATDSQHEGGRVTIASSLGAINDPHMLVENLPRKKNQSGPQDIDCFLCRKMGKELKTIYSCIQCKKGFHVNCFTAFHYRGMLSRKHSTLLDVVFNSDVNPTMGKPSVYAPSSTDHMLLPTEKESLFPRAMIRTKANKRANEQRKKDNVELRRQRKMSRTLTNL